MVTKDLASMFLLKDAQVIVSFRSKQGTKDLVQYLMFVR